jgi:rhodanese-related sulfurtransferase
MAAITMLPATSALAQTVFDTTLGETNQTTAEVSTQELKEIIKRGDAVVLDARPPLEYAVSHIPGALNVAPQPGRPAHLYVSDVAEIGRLVGGVKTKALVIYCNGPFCGKTKRLGPELLLAGYTNVRRYQLGAPVWRSLAGEAMQTELAALRYIAQDKTAIWIDAREAAAFKAGTIPGARNIAPSGLRPGKDQGVMKQAKDDGRLPMDDHNTRVIVFGSTSKDARAVADAIAGEAFHNVSFVAEPVEQVQRALPQPPASAGACNGFVEAAASSQQCPQWVESRHNGWTH